MTKENKITQLKSQAYDTLRQIDYHNQIIQNLKQELQNINQAIQEGEKNEKKRI